MTTDQMIYGVAMALAGLLVWRFSVQYDQFLEEHRDRTGLAPFRSFRTAKEKKQPSGSDAPN
ncbi:MAG: hypothetical protein K2X29_05600 [Candidatus Obscuribacterales bacterium]|nr:hypothetical protein [Candidatus Obscuribacterales bacterium]